MRRSVSRLEDTLKESKKNEEKLVANCVNVREEISDIINRSVKGNGLPLYSVYVSLPLSRRRRRPPTGNKSDLNDGSSRCSLPDGIYPSEGPSRAPSGGRLIVPSFIFLSARPYGTKGLIVI